MIEILFFLFALGSVAFVLLAIWFVASKLKEENEKPAFVTVQKTWIKNGNEYTEACKILWKKNCFIISEKTWKETGKEMGWK